MMKRAYLVSLAVIVACGGPKPTPGGPGPGPGPGPGSGAPDGGGPGSTAGTPPVTPVGALPLWPEVKRGTLPNGLTYYVMKHARPAKRASLWLAVNAGSLSEDDDQRGLAHFVEHMAFNGTKNYPENELIKYLERSGMRFGADINAYTNLDETVYKLEVPTDGDPEHRRQFVDKGFDILHEWGSAVAFDKAEVEKERGVVLEEWRLGRGASQRLFDKHIKVLLKGSRYADRMTIGLPETLKGAPRDTLVRFYKDWYRPDMMAVIAVGDFEDAAAIEQQIIAKFGDLKNPPQARPRPRGGVPVGEGTRVSIETDREETQHRLAVYNIMPHRAEASQADFRRIILEQVYSQIINERLDTVARKKEAPFMRANASVSGFTREIDAFTRTAIVRGGRVEDALKSLFTEVLRVEQHGFTQSELDRAKISITRAAEQSAVDAPTDDAAVYTSEITRNFFEREFMVGRVAERDLTLKLLPQVTLTELDSLAKSYGGADNRVIVISGPASKPVPTQERVLAIVAEVANGQIAPWIDKAAVMALMTQPPQPGTIVKETKLDAVGVTEWTLSNGARVIVKPTDFDADSIMLSGSSPGGLATATQRQYRDVRFADTVVAIGGVDTLDADSLKKVLTGKRASAATSINEVTESVSASASARDLETMFQLVVLRMTKPRKDDEAIGVWKENVAESLVDSLSNPDARFGIESSKVLWKNHARRKRAEPAEITKIDVDKAFAFYKDRFGDASDFTFVIVGSVDLAKLKPLVETYLASLPAKGRKEQEKDLGVRRVAGVVKQSWALGQDQEKARASLLFHGDEAWSRDKDRDMYILGRVLSMRLREIMREDMGGVYGVGAGGSLTRSPHAERSFTVQFGADPKRVDELLAAARKEIAAIAKTGIGADYLEKVKKIFERERETQLRSNPFWSSWLESSYRYGDDPTIINDPAPMIARMTSDHVKAAARRYLDTRRVFQAVMLPATRAVAPATKPAKDPKLVPGAEKPPADPKSVPGAEQP